MKMPILSLSNVADKLNNLNSALSTSDEVMDLTCKDMISRAPGKVASAVTDIFGIKKSEIKYNKKVVKNKAGYISVRGETLSSLELRYAGRTLTPLHFGMTPKSRPEGKKKYKIKAKIRKGKLTTFYPREKRGNKTYPDYLHGDTFLAPASKSTTIIPWFRNSSDRLDISPIKTLSLPQMVSNEDVSKIYGKELGELLQDRYNHQLKRHFKKVIG